MKHTHRRELLAHRRGAAAGRNPGGGGEGRSLPIVWLFTLVALLSSAAFAQLRPLVFVAELSGDSLSTPLASEASGVAMAVLVGNQLTITGSYRDLSSPMPVLGGILRGANIRLGEGAAVQLSAEQAIAGVPLRMSLTASGGTSGVVHGMFTITDEQIRELKAGRYHVQLYSQDHPAGELRGQLVAEIDTDPSAQDMVGIWRLAGEGEDEYRQYYADGSLDFLDSLDEANDPAAASHSWTLEDNLLTVEIAGHLCTGRYTDYVELLRDGRLRSFLLEQPAGGCATAHTWTYFTPVDP